MTLIEDLRRRAFLWVNIETPSGQASIPIDTGYIIRLLETEPCTHTRSSAPSSSC